MGLDGVLGGEGVGPLGEALVEGLLHGGGEDLAGACEAVFEGVLARRGLAFGGGGAGGGGGCLRTW